jgi:ArsR family transcriptional regulator, arsenate/arsenite/antimonite-responsive transcriptional repressor
MPTKSAGSATVPAELTSDERIDLVFKALASKPRREILRLLATGAGEDDSRCCSAEEVCACVFSERLGIGAPTVSHHMKSLIEAGLVTAEKRGSWVYYRLQPDAVQRVAAEMLSLVGCGTGGC